MKVETVNEEKFEPIEIKLTIESEEELCDLWHRMNVNHKKINDASNNYVKHESNGSTGAFWYELKVLVRSRGLMIK